MVTVGKWLVLTTIAIGYLTALRTTAPITASAGETRTTDVKPPSTTIGDQPVGVVVDDGVPF